ncbi:MAG: ABC transporter ATP-binding protein [Cloacibacillus sp.]
MSVAITISNVKKIFDKNIIINDLSLAVRPGEFFTLLGPSGCGKTTLLRMIIGFNSIEGGEIKIDDKVINDVPTNKRNMGMVFQNYAVFPHMSVRDNVAYGLKTRGTPAQQKKEMVDEILKITRIEEYADRMPTQLSGGQQQRVALARAIVIHPDVLLMDEPLSNLDAKLRIEMRNAIKKIQKQMGITTVYVTHDQEEALAVSDRIAVMHGGIIQQIDSPKKIYQRPCNLFVSTFIGLSNILEATVESRGGARFLRLHPDYAPEMTTLCDVPDGRPALASIRPEEFSVSADMNSAGIPAVVRSSVFLGVNLHYFVELPDGKEAEIIQETDLSDMIPDGTKVRLTVHPLKINVFDAERKQTLIREGA